MDAIKFSVWVGEDKKLILDLPPEMPVGLVDVQISLRRTEDLGDRPATNGEQVETWAEKRERFRKILLEAGLLSTVHYATEGSVPLTDEERMRLGTLPPGARPTDEYVDEDRGPR